MKYTIEDNTLTAVADKMREKTGKVEMITPEEMPGKVNEVFVCGEDNGWNRFWDAVQNFGNRTDYASAFRAWCVERIRPKYKVNGKITQVASVFFNNKNLISVEAEWFDFSEAILPANPYSYMFSSCNSLQSIEDIGMSAPELYDYTWAYSGSLHTIAVIRCVQKTKFNNAFLACNSLESITIEGIVGQNGLDVHYSTELSHDSLLSIINALEDYSADESGTVWKVTLGETNLAKLSEEEIGIAEGKGWVLA